MEEFAIQNKVQHCMEPKIVDSVAAWDEREASGGFYSIRGCNTAYDDIRYHSTITRNSGEMRRTEPGMEDRIMEVAKQSGKDSQVQLEGLFSEDSSEGKGRETASVPVRKKPEEGIQPTITSEEESLFTKTMDHIVSFLNMLSAFRKMSSKKEAGGVDGMKAEELT